MTTTSAHLAIVDDDQPFAEYLQTLLRSRGYETSTYDSGDSLLSGLREGALPDVVLLDVSLPDTDGFAILERMRNNQKLSKMPVVMMTGKSEVTDIAKGLSLGADGYVTKPFKIAGLVSAVKTVLGLDS